jgi:NAD(P)-dependent dehydrogenase (short-subunit alcohol dehydrogenase family)
MSEKPVTLITGASRGIGYATAVALAKKGHHIIALARTIGGLESLADEVGNENITLIPQNVTNGKALESLGPQIFERFGRLDNFIANAGAINTLSPIAQADPQEWSRVFAVNVTANLHLIRTLDPLLRAANHGQSVFVTSNVATDARPYWGAYAASKAALESMVRSYQAEVAQTNMRVHLYNPGSVATKMWAASHPGQDQSSLKQPDEAAQEIADLLLSF